MKNDRLARGEHYALGHVWQLGASLDKDNNGEKTCGPEHELSNMLFAYSSATRGVRKESITADLISAQGFTWESWI